MDQSRVPGVHGESQPLSPSLGPGGFPNGTTHYQNGGQPLESRSQLFRAPSETTHFRGDHEAGRPFSPHESGPPPFRAGSGIQTGPIRSGASQPPLRAGSGMQTGPLRGGASQPSFETPPLRAGSDMQISPQGSGASQPPFGWSGQHQTTHSHPGQWQGGSYYDATRREQQGDRHPFNIKEESESGSDMVRVDEDSQNTVNEDSSEEEMQNERPKIHTAVLAVAVDEKNIMAEHESYHEEITGAEAERRLKLIGTNSYLTRYSNKKKSYVLTVFKQQIPEDVIKHYKIVIQNGYKIDGKQFMCGDIRTLLEHYEKNRLDPAIKAIGEKHTLKDFLQREKEEKDKKEREEREREQREREQREREQRERVEREQREQREREEREQREQREQREREEREQRERQRRCIIL